MYYEIRLVPEVLGNLFIDGRTHITKCVKGLPIGTEYEGYVIEPEGILRLRYGKLTPEGVITTFNPVFTQLEPKFLELFQFMRDRLVNVYSDSENVDFIIKADELLLLLKDRK